MHDMRQLPCPMCGRSVMVSGGSSVPCPSCGVPVSAPVAAELPASPILADDDSATRVATIPPADLPSEPAPMAAVGAPPAVVVAATPAVEPPTPLSAPVSPMSAASDTTDPRTQPVSAAEVWQAAYPPAMPALAATPASGQPETQTYHGTPPPQQPETQTYAPVVAPVVAPGAAQAAPVAPKRTPALLIIGAVVAVVLLLGIIGAAVVFANHAGQKTVAQPTATTAATATSAIPAGFTQFIDAGNVYTVNYPSGWTKTATSGDYSLTIFSGTPAFIPGVFEVEYFKTTVDPKTLQDQFFKGLSISGKIVNKQGPTTTSLAGESWQRETADVTSAGGAQHVVVLTTNHGQYSVVIAYLAAQMAFEDADTHDFQPMLGSFQFVR